MENNTYESEYTPEQPTQKKNTKKIWLLIGLGVAVVAIVAVLLFLFVFKGDKDSDGKSKEKQTANTYETPVKLMEDFANVKDASVFYEKETEKLNGFCEKEYKEIVEIQKKSDDYDKALGYIDESIEMLKEEYGDNYKVKYEITDEEELAEEECSDFRDELRDAGNRMINSLEDMDSDDYKDIAEAWGITKEQAKEIVQVYQDIAKTLKSAEITAGYELIITQTLTGSELDEPKVTENMKLTVYKINGTWVSSETLSMLVGSF